MMWWEGYKVGRVCRGCGAVWQWGLYGGGAVGLWGCMAVGLWGLYDGRVCGGTVKVIDFQRLLLILHFHNNFYENEHHHNTS